MVRGSSQVRGTEEESKEGLRRGIVINIYIYIYIYYIYIFHGSVRE